jgi:HAD superfamily hydrolase (TIGR01509 family)
MISAVICDLDGLLADTEKLHFQAYKDVLTGYEVALTEVEYNDLWTRQGRGIADFVKLRSLQYDPEEILTRKIARYNELLSCRVDPMPGAVALLEQLHGQKRLALASSSYEKSIGIVLEALDIRRFFEVVTHKTSARRPKPYPDQFLLTAKLLKVPPAECVVLEDAEKGIVAASDAGMKSIAVPNRHTKDNDFSRATVIVPSLDDITVKLLDALDTS